MPRSAPGGTLFCTRQASRVDCRETVPAGDRLTVRLNVLIWRIRALVRPRVTLGAQCLVIDRAGRILLVRHTYAPQWHFPGGGVDPHESAREAAIREVGEETGLALQRAPRFFALYFNKALAGRDHVALFVAEDVPEIDTGTLRAQAMEIADVGMFARDALPADTSRSVRRRLAELAGEVPIAELW